MDNIEAIFKQWEEVPGSEAVLREVAELMRSCKSWEEVQDGLAAMIRGAQTTLSQTFQEASEGQQQ